MRDPPPKDQNQINQHDGHYMALRAKANEQGDLMGRCFQQSHEAYGRGDGAHAKELSEQGKQHERTMVSLNAEASAWIFRGECDILFSESCRPCDLDREQPGTASRTTVSFLSYSSDARQDSKPGEIDLHGLYVKEAVSYADKSIQEARQRGDAEIRFIVGELHSSPRACRHYSVIILGKGLHSDGHVAKLRPAIEDLVKK